MVGAKSRSSTAGLQSCRQEWKQLMRSSPIISPVSHSKGWRRSAVVIRFVL